MLELSILMMIVVMIVGVLIEDRRRNNHLNSMFEDSKRIRANNKRLGV